MIHKRVEGIVKSDIEQLVSDAVREGRDIEYKRDLSFANEDEKRKVLASVTSFANAGGGDLIYGVVATEGIPTEAKGIAVPVKDQLELQLSHLIRNGIQPRLTGCQVRFIDGFSNGSVVLIRIPRGWHGPHMVSLGDFSKFYTRSGPGKHTMDWGEIRSAFALADDLPKKMNDFRMERLGLAGCQ